jgi:voltage-gated potassium channel
MRRKVSPLEIFLILLRRLRVPFALFVLFHVVVVPIYMASEGVTWDTALFWITHPRMNAEHVMASTKIFATFVYTGVFAFKLWFAERVLSAIFAPVAREAWTMIRNQLDVAKIQDHFIVCGYGQVGRTVVQQLRKAQIPLVLIESNEGLYKEVVAEGIPVISGDGRQRNVLMDAGIERAKGICVLIDNDAENLYITITARSLNPHVKILMRAGQRRYAEAMRKAGADEVIIPEYEGGLMVSRLVEKYAGRAPGVGPGE